MDRPNLNLLLAKVSKLCGTGIGAMRSEMRDNHTYEARLIYAAIAKDYNYRAYEIAWALNKAESTGTNYVRQMRDRLADPYFVQKYKLIKRKIERWFQGMSTSI